MRKAIAALLLGFASLSVAVAEDLPGHGGTIAVKAGEWEREISARRTEYLDWIVERFGTLEPGMKPLDGRAWSLNQARLFLNRETDKANRYFENVKLTFDADFMGIRLLKTWLDYHKTDRLSDQAKKHLRDIIRDWPMSRKDGISRTARWPPGFT
jgi:hypothetical protein